MLELDNIIDNVKEITIDIYHNLINNYSKELIDNYLDTRIEQELLLCESPSDKIKVWNKYSYYLSTKEHSIYELKELETIKDKEDNFKYFTNKDQIVYGLHLLSKKHLIILKDNTNETSLDIERIFASITTKEIRNYVLDRLNFFYNTTTRVSINDENIKKFLTKYYLLSKKTDNINNKDLFPQITNPIPEEYLKEQIDMYIRYSLAKEEYIKHNITLAKYTVTGMLKLSREIDDLAAEGIFGLSKAVDTYDVRLGHKFSTYATSVIEREIKYRSNNYDLGIVLPVRKYLDKIKIANKRDELTLELKRIPTPKELADSLNMKEEKIIKMLEIMSKTNFCSINEELDKEGLETFTIEKFLQDDNLKFESDIIRKQLVSIILFQMDKILTPKEKDIILKRTGYNQPGEIPMTLQELSAENHLTIEGIRQAEQRGLKKLRKDPIIQQCNPFTS